MSHIILCVDDDKTVLNALRTLLTNTLPEGCRVEVAESGPECIEVCQALEAEGLTPPLW
jgi:CheY-like chemotaxis protein